MRRLPTVAIAVVLIVACKEDQQSLAPSGSAAVGAIAAAPQGFIEEPRIGEYVIPVLNPTNRAAASAANLDQEFTFKGWVNFPPGQGQLWFYVDHTGDSYPGNGSTRIRIAQPLSTTRIVGGQTVWNFSIGPFKPFRELVNQKSFAKPWQDGGTGRINIYAFRFSDGQTANLPGRDRQAVRGNLFGPLVFADGDATPVSQSKYIPPLYPVPDYLGKKNQTGTPAETEDYYQSVYITPNGLPAPAFSIRDLIPTLQQFKTRYFQSCQGVAGSYKVDASPAIYFNKGDLGIGREMHCSYNVCTKETACYVRNFGSATGKALFNATNIVPSRDAIAANKPFATVVMVSRGLMAQGAPNKVFFAVYGPTGTLVTEAQLDNRQYNKFIPGNCLVCHGAQARYVKSTREVYFAHFLPFDLQHGFTFYSTTASNPLSRAAQEGKFKTLNRLVATTDLYTLPNARALLNGFYGASAAHSNPNTWPSPTFKNDWVPSGWNTAGFTRQLYKQVMAGNCRTCHVSHASVHFGSYSDFVNFAFAIQKAVCGGRGADIMPNAEVTSKAFWRSSARAQLVNQANFAGCGLLGPDAGAIE
jgi:mono/diheme cytochrome c family protein